MLPNIHVTAIHNYEQRYGMNAAVRPVLTNYRGSSERCSLMMSAPSRTAVSLVQAKLTLQVLVIQNSMPGHTTRTS